MSQLTGSSISLCMIVKNEEHFIRNCLNSVLPIVDEIVIADTGSTDNTVSIAKEFNANIFQFEWIDDFAAARNATIEKATKDWILILDADEEIALSDLIQFKKLTEDSSICTEFLQRHYTNDVRLSDFKPCANEFPELEKQYAGFFESNCVRLFPNNHGLKYNFRIHELVEPSIYEKKRHSIVRTNIRIHHYGHTPEVIARKTKTKVYQPLGEKKVDDLPTDWKAFYELGIEYNVNGRKAESVEYFKRSIELNPNYIHTWTNLGYALMELESYQEAIEALRGALKIDPLNQDAYCNIGVIGLRSGNLILAEESTIQAININPKYINALRNLVRIYYTQKRFSEAVLVCHYILSIIPKMPAVLADLGSIYLENNEGTIAYKYLIRSLSLDDKQPHAHFNLAQILRLQGNFEAAKNSYRRCHELDPSLVLPSEIKAFIEV